MSPTTVSVFAPAKVNLALHITGQRPDGYHLLDSLVAFATVGDHLRITPAERLSLTVDGTEVDGVPLGEANLALKAAALFKAEGGAVLALEKHLPSASGIGGGSADAAASFRGMRALLQSSEASEQTRDDDQANSASTTERLLSLGADIPMCLASRTARVRGIGEHVEAAPVPPMPALLVNPRVPLSTPAVFRALTVKNNAPMPENLPAFSDCASAIEWLRSQRNDLESPAARIAPIVGDVLKELRDTERCGLARMSGSGATCFALFAEPDDAKSAADSLRKRHAEWWIAECALGDQSGAASPRIT